MHGYDQKVLSITLDPGIVIYYRAPTKEEIAKYKNPIQFADVIITDVGNLGYRDKKGKLKPLGMHVNPKQIRHLRAFGKRPKSWKDLIPPKTKLRFIWEIEDARNK